MLRHRQPGPSLVEPQQGSTGDFSRPHSNRSCQIALSMNFNPHFTLDREMIPLNGPSSSLLLLIPTKGSSRIAQIGDIGGLSTNCPHLTAFSRSAAGCVDCG